MQVVHFLKQFGFWCVQDGYASLKGFPRTLWVALFVEGTRFTKAKLEAAKKYAADAGLRVPKHVLVPRTKVKIYTCILDWCPPLLQVEQKGVNFL